MPLRSMDLEYQASVETKTKIPANRLQMFQKNEKETDHRHDMNCFFAYTEKRDPTDKCGDASVILNDETVSRPIQAATGTHTYPSMFTSVTVIPCTGAVGARVVMLGQRVMNGHELLRSDQRSKMRGGSRRPHEVIW